MKIYPHLKRYTRFQFNRSAIGSEMAALGLIDAIENDRTFFDEWKPYFIHEVAAQWPTLDGSHYLFYGRKEIDGTFFTVTLGNGNFDDAYQEIMPFGNGAPDRIDAHFLIPANGRTLVDLIGLNKFECAEARPKGSMQAGAILGEIETHMKEMRKGTLINFQKVKLDLYASVGRPFAPHSLTDVWARTLIGDVPPLPTPINRLIAAPGGLHHTRTYIKAP